MLNPRQKESLSIAADLISVISAAKDFALVLILPLFGILIGSSFLVGNKSSEEPGKTEIPPAQSNNTPPVEYSTPANTQAVTDIQKSCVEAKFYQSKLSSSQFRESAKCFKK